MKQLVPNLVLATAIVVFTFFLLTITASFMVELVITADNSERTIYPNFYNLNLRFVLVTVALGWPALVGLCRKTKQKGLAFGFLFGAFASFLINAVFWISGTFRGF